MSSDFSDQALRDLVRDRNALRIEVIPSAEITPIQAAWMMGRLCNELHFRLQRAWLFFPVDEPERTRQIWVDLAALIARIVDDFQAVSQTRTTIDRVRANWDSCNQSEWHSDENFQAIVTLGLYLDKGEPLPDGFGEVDYLADLSTRAATTVNELELHFRKVLSEPERLAFQLGRIADQLIHPLLSSRVFRIQGTLDTPVQLSGSWDCGDTSSGIRNERHWRDLRLPDQLRVPWPDSEWLREIEHIYARFCRCADQQATGLVASWTPATPAAHMLDALDNCIYESAKGVPAGTLNPDSSNPPPQIDTGNTEIKVIPNQEGDSSNPTPQIDTGKTDPENPMSDSGWTKTRCGIEFNRRLFQVRRTGTDLVVTPDKRMDFYVLEFIAIMGKGFRSRNELKSEWETLGGETDGENSIDGRLTAIRKVLKTLGMRLQNIPRVGWRVVEINEP